MTSVDDLMELASKATPGERGIDVYDGDSRCPRLINITISNGKQPPMDRLTSAWTEDDKRFIAACDPQTITDLCRRLKAAEEEVERLRAFCLMATDLRESEDKDEDSESVDSRCSDKTERLRIAIDEWLMVYWAYNRKAPPMEALSPHPSKGHVR